MKSMIMFSMVMVVFVSMNLLAQNDMSKTDMSNLRSTFQQLHDQRSESFKGGDLNTIVSYYTDDALAMPPYIPLRKGKNEILSGTKGDFQHGLKFSEFKFKSDNVYGTGDLAVEEGTFNMKVTPPNRTDQISDHGNYVIVWQKQSDNSWKIKTEIMNSNVDPLNTNQAGAKEKENK